MSATHRGLEPGPSREDSVYRRMTAVCDRVADAALRGAGAAELAAVFAQMTRKTVLLLDPGFGLRTHASAGADVAGPDLAGPDLGGSGVESLSGGVPVWDPESATVGRLLRVLAAERRPLRVPPVPGTALSQGCLAMPVTAGESALGYLLVLGGTGTAEPDDADLIITSYVATLFALTLAREQTTLELGLRYQGTVVDALVSGHFLDHHDARRRARELGLADGQPFRVAVTRSSVEDPRGEGPARLLGDLAAATRSPFVLRGSELVMIVPEPPGATATAPQSAGRRGARNPRGREAPLDVLARLVAKPGISCGVSEHVTAPEHAPHGLRQAAQAIELGLRLGRAGQLVRYEDLGVYRLLLQIGDMNQLWRFAADVLGPLIDYDASHKVGLIATLSAYLAQHESLKQTARVLGVHVNTVAYRVQRIGQLTALDLAAPDDRLLAHIAIKIIEAQAPHPSPPPKPPTQAPHPSPPPKPLVGSAKLV